MLSKTQDIQEQSIKTLHESVAMLCDTAMMHTSRIDLLAARMNDVEELTTKIHKHVLWYLIAVIIVNVGFLIYTLVR